MQGFSLDDLELVGDFEFVDAYLERIDLPMLPAIDPDGLLMLQTNHLRHIPYENLDAINGTASVNLDATYLWDKIVRRRRGGIDFEQNVLFAAVLERLGFTVRRMAAHDPLLGMNEYDHMFLMVDFPRINRTWMADVGFPGGYLAPIQFTTGTWQSDMRDMMRIDTLGNDVYDVVRRNEVGEEEVLYEFNLTEHTDEQYLKRFEWYLTNRMSPVLKGPYVTLDAIDGRITLTEHEFSGHIAGEPFSQAITSQDQFDLILAERFGIVL